MIAILAILFGLGIILFLSGIVLWLYSQFSHDDAALKWGNVLLNLSLVLITLGFLGAVWSGETSTLTKVFLTVLATMCASYTIGRSR